MGLLVSDTDFSGRTVAGIRLGVPILTLEAAAFGWDDPRLPDGTIEADGTIVPAPAEASE